MMRESNPQRSWSRRDWLRWCGKGMAALPLVSLLACSKDRARTLHTPGGAPYQGTDEQLLEEIERASFQFFWEQTNPGTGQVKDRAFLNDNDTRTMSSIAATGFGLTALCIGDKRGYGKKQEIIGRVRATLEFVWEKLPEVHGFFYHFLGIDTGQRWAQSGLSSIVTFLLFC